MTAPISEGPEMRKAAAGRQAAFLDASIAEQRVHSNTNPTGYHGGEGAGVTEHFWPKNGDCKAGPLANLGYKIWGLAYSLEEARQRYAATGKLLREAFACIALAILLLGGAV